MTSKFPLLTTSSTMDFKEVNLFHLDENGKCFEFWGIQDDPDEANAFWAP